MVPLSHIGGAKPTFVESCVKVRKARKSDSLVPGTTFQSSATLGCVQITNILARVTGNLTESNLLDFMNYNSTS